MEVPTREQTIKHLFINLKAINHTIRSCLIVRLLVNRLKSNTTAGRRQGTVIRNGHSERAFELAIRSGHSNRGAAVPGSARGNEHAGDSKSERRPNRPEIMGNLLEIAELDN